MAAATSRVVGLACDGEPHQDAQRQVGGAQQPHAASVNNVHPRFKLLAGKSLVLPFP
jgi:hypothetical protein